MGEWLQINGEAIYETVPWRVQNETAANVWYTAKNDTVFAILLEWPQNNTVVLSSPVPQSVATVDVTMLGFKSTLSWSYTDDLFYVQLPLVPFVQLPSTVAWVLQLNGVK